MTIHRIRLSKMQKIVNIIALTSGAVSLAVVASGLYVYVQRDQLIDTVKQQALEAVLGGSGGLGGSLGGSLGGDALPTGATDLSPTTNPDANPQAAAPSVPVKYPTTTSMTAVALLMMLQPNLGSAIIFFSIWKNLLAWTTSSFSCMTIIKLRNYEIMIPSN